MIIESSLRRVEGLQIIERQTEENFVGSSFQFLLLNRSYAEIQAIVEGCKSRGLNLNGLAKTSLAASLQNMIPGNTSHFKK